MAKTIIKAGIDPNYEYVSRCRICGTIFKYKYLDMDGDPIQAWHEPHITCPTCGNMMAMNDKPMKEVEVNLPANSLYRLNGCILVEAGMEVYIVYKSGSVYQLKRLEEGDLTPNRSTILFATAVAKFTQVPGVEIDNPEPNKEYARIDEINDLWNPSYSTIDPENGVIPIELNTTAIYGIPSQLVEVTKIQIL